MANVLMSYFAELGEPMYDAVSEVLLENGNNVFRFNINNSNVSITRWGDVCKMRNSKITDSIKEFNPDIVLSYNNALPIGVESVLRGDCVKCVIDADNANYLWNRDYILGHRTDYLYLGQQSASKGVYEKYLDMPLGETNYLYFPGATVIHNKPETKDKNVSFIGTNFHLPSMPLTTEYYSDTGVGIYDLISKDYYYDLNQIKSRYPDIANPDNLIEEIRTSLAGQERLKCLQAVSDLGLTVYGVRWNNVAYYDFELAKCIDKTVISTVEQNEWVYNTSKVSLNVSHPQAVSSFSWRVMDIMASGSCLVTESKKDWMDLFGEYLSDETMRYVIYSDRYGLRNNVIKLLEDENLRTKCVGEMNQAIEKNGRWNSRFASLEKQTGVKLIGCHNANPECMRISGMTALEASGSSKQKSSNYVTRLLRNGIYRISHVPRIRHFLWDVIRP